jgi:hypothetical protein
VTMVRLSLGHASFRLLMHPRRKSIPSLHIRELLVDQFETFTQFDRSFISSSFPVDVQHNPPQGWFGACNCKVVPHASGVLLELHCCETLSPRPSIRPICVFSGLVQHDHVMLGVSLMIHPAYQGIYLGTSYLATLRMPSVEGALSCCLVHSSYALSLWAIGACKLRTCHCLPIPSPQSLETHMSIV